MEMPLHALLAGAWVGCVLVEALFERALLGQGRDKELILARLHWKVDLFIEGPLLASVAVTGLLIVRPIFAAQAVDVLLQAKLVFAALAILANIWCIRLVKVRLNYAEAGEWEAFERVDNSQHRWGALVLVGLLGSAILGLVR
ncbi:hypothetical protein [Qipengyuania sp. RANM35]|uniref:hypothetical protein n=1 Tax=Qipengyuania sp. RANM35 TaxID=3068635 RepID=UPI0034DB3ED1